MSDDDTVIEEAAKVISKPMRADGREWDEVPEGWRAVCRKAVRDLRDFWAAHAEPGTHSTSDCLRVTAKYMIGARALGREIDMQHFIDTADRLDRDQDRDMRIGQTIFNELRDHYAIRFDSKRMVVADWTEIGKAAREAVEGEA